MWRKIIVNCAFFYMPGCCSTVHYHSLKWHVVIRRFSPSRRMPRSRLKWRKHRVQTRRKQHRQHLFTFVLCARHVFAWFIFSLGNVAVVPWGCQGSYVFALFWWWLPRMLLLLLQLLLLSVGLLKKLWSFFFANFRQETSGCILVLLYITNYQCHIFFSELLCLFCTGLH